MPKLWICENHVALGGEPGGKERCGLGDSDVYETFTDNVGALYTSLVKEHGRCTGRMYVDEAVASAAGGGGTRQRHVGWVFLRRKKYEGRVRDGDPKTYLH